MSEDTLLQIMVSAAVIIVLIVWVTSSISAFDMFDNEKLLDNSLEKYDELFKEINVTFNFETEEVTFSNYDKLYKGFVNGNQQLWIKMNESSFTYKLTNLTSKSEISRTVYHEKGYINGTFVEGDKTEICYVYRNYYIISLWDSNVYPGGVFKGTWMIYPDTKTIEYLGATIFC